MGDDREMVESFFDEKTDYAIGVEDEVGSFGVFIADHAVRCEVSHMSLGKDKGMGSYVNSAMSCGV